MPIVPYNTTWLFVAIRQRYDVVFTASATIGNYWFRAEFQTGCGNNANNANILAVFNNGAASADPTSMPTATYVARCADETGLAPFDPKRAPSSAFTLTPGDTMTVIGPTRVNGLNAWTINGPVLEMFKRTELVS